MNEDFKDGYVQAYLEILAYAKSMIETDPNPQAWLDMTFYAYVSLEELAESATSE